MKRQQVSRINLNFITVVFFNVIFLTCSRTQRITYDGAFRVPCLLNELV
jgi:hypothetical protein